MTGKPDMVRVGQEFMNSRHQTRRQFLSSASAAGSLFVASSLSSPIHSFPAGPVLMEAKTGSTQLLETVKNQTSIWGFDGTVPGPIIRVKQGDEVWVHLKNSLPQPTTIHWHGIRIENAMDGVAGLTQEPVPPGETFDYRFTVPDAGTFWYHPHNRSWEQVARGLYGALIVEEPNAPDVDQDIIVVVDDWRLDENGAIHEESFGSIRDKSHAGRLGNILSVNGNPTGKFNVRSGERVRLRLINTCNARILKFRFEELNPQVIALDGQPVTPYELESGMVTIAPAQRVDLLIDMIGEPGSTQAITEVSISRLVAAIFIYNQQPSLPSGRSQLKLPLNGLIEPDMSSARKVDLIMSGGAMGQADKITFKGQSYDLRQLVREHGKVWAFNGNAGMAEKPLFSAKLGESIAVRMVNETRWPHAMHFHGHHFREAKENAPWRDTLLMDASETRTVFLKADNPGKWMIHCHMLEHQAGGMATWFEVK
jgi:FtsP/CotA-like multicopper oxidase with cupredoxin domain